MMDVSVAPTMFISGIVVLLLPLALLIVTIVLLANRKTRTAGFVLLGIDVLGGIGVVGLGAIFFLKGEGSSTSVSEVSWESSSASDGYTDHTKKMGSCRTSAESTSVPLLVEARHERYVADPLLIEARPDSYVADDPAEVSAAPTEKTTVSEATPETPETDDSRPSWVKAEPQQVGGVYRMSIVVGPYTTRSECDEHLNKALQEAVAQYIGDHVGSEAGRRVRLPDAMLRERLVKQRWEETRRYSVGLMKNLHVLLEFDRKFNGEIDEAWRQAQIEDRIGGVAGVGVLVLGSLAALFGLLKVVGRKRS